MCILNKTTVIKLEPFKPSDFDLFISWIDSKELLLQIAGNYFSYPLTPHQLKNYIDDKNSFAFGIVETSSNQVIGHSEIILLDNKICKLDKVLIGDIANRGKGVGQKVVTKLLAFSFENLSAEEVELYVYDWNTGAIKTYENVGFVINHDKQMLTDVDGKVWKALNMTIDKREWLSLQQQK
jgi:RimJ/RimL family protein N-acetyltransferase